MLLHEERRNRGMLKGTFAIIIAIFRAEQAIYLELYSRNLFLHVLIKRAIVKGRCFFT